MIATQGQLCRQQCGSHTPRIVKAPTRSKISRTSVVSCRPMRTLDTNPINENGRITETACMEHAHRKIRDIHVQHPTTVTTGTLNRIGELYTAESENRSRSAEERLVVRKTRSIPLMQSLHDWIQQQMGMHVIVSLRYSKNVRIPAEIMGYTERILPQWLGRNR